MDNRRPARHADPDPGESQLSVADTTLGKTRLLARKCRTCIFRHADPMDIGADRLRDMIRQAQTTSGYIICHNTLPYGPYPQVPPAICRGFADSYDTPALRLIRQLWGFVNVNPPGESDGHDGHDVEGEDTSR